MTSYMFTVRSFTTGTAYCFSEDMNSMWSFNQFFFQTVAYCTTCKYYFSIAVFTVIGYHLTSIEKANKGLTKKLKTRCYTSWPKPL